MSVDEVEAWPAGPNKEGTPLTPDQIFQIAQEKFLKFIKPVAISKLLFFTFKDNSGKYHKMDKVRKWCSKWASHFIIVRSPVGGIHFHGIGVKIEHLTVRYLKGIHLHVQPLGERKEERSMPTDYSYEAHPCISNYEVSTNFMLVMAEIRARFPEKNKKTSLPARIRSRVKRAEKKIHDSLHVHNTIMYLQKNFREGGMLPYDDIVCN